jgi:plastocyanin
MRFAFPKSTFRTALLIVVAGPLLCAAAAPPAAKEHKVSIDNLKYEPREIKIKKGETVVWTNGDDRDHTVTADDGSFTSKKIASRDTYERKFAKAGKYKYHCDYHPRMKGTVVVEE